MIEGALDWLAGLPPAALYLTLAVTAAAENLFPPLPADTVVAFGSFLAARGDASVWGAFLSTWLGNVLGAMAVYVLGRRFGAGWLTQRLERFGGASRERQMRDLYARWGLGAIFLSRFIPGVRAIVPPFAGALRMPAPRVAIIIAVASALWYGLVTFVAYRLGSDWDAVTAALGSLGIWSAVIAAALAGAGVAWWIWRRRRA